MSSNVLRNFKSRPLTLHTRLTFSYFRRFIQLSTVISLKELMSIFPHLLLNDRMANHFAMNLNSKKTKPVPICRTQLRINTLYRNVMIKKLRNRKIMDTQTKRLSKIWGVALMMVDITTESNQILRICLLMNLNILKDQQSGYHRRTRRTM